MEYHVFVSEAIMFENIIAGNDNDLFVYIRVSVFLACKMIGIQDVGGRSES